ncbi:MAG TPA: MFS transporter [Burkholderiales bacterium]|nr:MFS transporter [Burkholderiales bacterium]
MLAACFLLNMLGRGMGDTYAVFLLPLEREFGWTRSQVTGVYSLYLLVNGFSAPLVGLFFDRVGPRWVYGAGVACLGTAFLLASTLATLWQFYLFIGVMVGLAVSLNGMVPASALLSRWYRGRLSTAIGIAFSAVGVGTLLFVPLAQYLVTELDWRTAYRWLGIALLLAVPLVVVALPWRIYQAGHPELQGARAKGAGQGATLREALRSPVFWSLSQVFFFTATAMFSILVQLVAFFIDAGFSPLVAATAYGALGMLSAFSVMMSGPIAERFGYRQSVTASFAGTATGIVLLIAITAAPSMLVLVAFVAAFGLCMGVRGPVISTISARTFAGPNVATIYGAIYSTNALGAAFGAFMGGLLHDVTGGYVAGLVMAFCAILVAVLPFWTQPAVRDFR